MKRKILSLILLLIILFLLLPFSSLAREIEPIAKTNWLEANLSSSKLIVLDIRHVEEYREGHIPGAQSAFYGGWAYKKGKLYSEIPDTDDLEDLIGSHGIGLDSVNDSVIDNCILESYNYNVAQDGIDLNSCQNITLNNIIIKGIGWCDGFKIIYSKKITASNIIIRGTTGLGFKLQGSYIDISNFCVENTGDDSVWTDASCSHLNMANGHIINSGDVGLMIDSNSNISVSNIEIYNSAGSGIRIGSAKNIVIDNLRVLKSTNYNYVASSSDVFITNSIFSYGASYGIDIVSSSFFGITNTIFERNAADGITTELGACNNYSIIGCIFKYNDEGIDCHVNDDWNIITLNHFIDDTLDDHYLTKRVIANNIGDDI